MTWVSTVVDGGSDRWEMKARLAATKSGLMSTAEMCREERLEVMAGDMRHWEVRTAGPEALSRMRRGAGAAGREGRTREMRWVARWMLQPPVRAL